MKKNDLLQDETRIVRILDIKKEEALVVEFLPLKMPVWIPVTELYGMKTITENELGIDFGVISQKAQNVMWSRLNMIAPLVQIVGDIESRPAEIHKVADKYNVSEQSVRHYLKLYLAYGDIRILAPKEKVRKTELSDMEKNFRWALNRYYYNRNKYSLPLTYKLLLKERYEDSKGQLVENYPSFSQFRYFYRKTKNAMNTIISREGKSKYERDYRPMVTEGVIEYASCPGVFMLDSTILDIYLINCSGKVIGRPVLTIAVDTFSGLCVGYHLSLEGGAYSVSELMKNIVTDKVEHCKRFGIAITEDIWPSHHLPYEFLTDRGKEYVSDSVFGHITELGCTITNLPPYRAERKGLVEQYFDCLNELYRPLLIGLGSIMDDFAERGSIDYRKQSALTLKQFETIILRCIIHCNSGKLKKYFPYSREMIEKGVQPTPAGIWKYGVEHSGVNLREISIEYLEKVLLPRTKGTYSRKGLKVRKLFYFNSNFTEEFLTGGEVEVAYRLENVNKVWVIKDMEFIEFSLIQKRYKDMDYDMVDLLKHQQSELLGRYEQEELKSSLELIDHIQTVASQGDTSVKDIKNIRENRAKERRNIHMEKTNE